MNPEFYKWVILPLLIFSARVLDVSLGTLRITFVSRGLRYLASLIGFFEVIIWLLAIRVIMQNLNNAVCYLAYGGGFAMGNFIGIYLENKLAFGNAILQVITQTDASELIQALRMKGYGITSTTAQGNEGNVNIIHMAIRRAEFETITDLIKKHNPRAFYTMEDVRFLNGGTFPKKNPGLIRYARLRLFQYWRKGK